MKRAGMADGYIAFALGGIESVRMARQQQETRRGVHDRRATAGKPALVADAAGLTMKRVADLPAGQGFNRPLPLMETSSGSGRNDHTCAVPPKSAA